MPSLPNEPDRETPLRRDSSRAPLDSRTETNVAMTLAIGHPRTVLDAGCGIGLNGAVAKMAGAHVVGLEPDAWMAERAHRVLDEVYAVPIEDDTAVSRALGSRTFDLILLPSALAHADSPTDLLRNLGRHLAPEGRIIASVENREAWPGRVRGAGTRPPLAHRAYTRDEAARLLSNAGYQVLQVSHNPLLVRALHPLLARTGLVHPPTQDNLNQAFRELSVYEAYRQIVRPLENRIAAALPRLLTHEHVVVARTPPRPGPLSVTVGMLTMDEEPSISRMLEEIRRHVPDAQILCVDSSLHDGTPLVAERCGARVIRQLPPKGHGPAMELLMYEASRLGDALIYLDCDFTYPPDQLPVIRQILESGADVVNAARTRHHPSAMPWPNYVANKTFAATARMLHGVPATDLHSGMRGYRSSVIRAFSFSGYGDAIPIDTLLFPARCGYHVVEIPISYQERVGYSKLRKFAGTTWTFIRLARLYGVGERHPEGYEVRPD